MLFLSKIKVPAKLVYIVISVLATIWFLVRVIPKPSRATYPCMQVVAPIMSGFVIWLIALSGAAFAFRKAKHKLLEARYIAAFLFHCYWDFSYISFYDTNHLLKQKLPVWRSGTNPIYRLV